MEFFNFVRVFRSPTDPISLIDCWMIDDTELNTVAKTSLKSLKNEKILGAKHRDLAWLIQALIEFMDLLQLRFHAGRQWKQNNYLYFEAVATLREATVGMLNGLPRASTGLLRSTLEMLMLHCWWQTKIKEKNGSDKFYCWLRGQRNGPNFNQVIKDNLDALGIPTNDLTIQHVKGVYKQLCSYVHAPLPNESMTTLSQGNQMNNSIDVMRSWMCLATDVLRIILKQFVHLYPQCIFPVDIIKKFGFNPPVGLYFDKYNFVPIMAIFDEAQIEKYRMRLRNHELVQTGVDFYKSRPYLTRDEILQTWDHKLRGDLPNNAADNLEGLYFQGKAETRVSSWALPYSTLM